MSEQKPWEMDWSKQFKNQSDNSSKNPWEMNWGKQEPQKQEEKGFLGQAQDAGVSLLKGVVAVPETIVGLADIPTGGQVGKFIEEKTPIQFKQAKDALNDLHTDQYKKQQKQFSEAGQNEDSLVAKVIEKGKVALSNPSMIFNTVVESAPSMLAGGAVGRGLGMASQAIKPIAAGAIGEGAVMAGQQAENIRYETDDKLLTPEQSGASIATGAIGSLFGLLGGQVAKKLGFDDLETAMASGRMNSQLVGDSIQKMPLSSIPKSIIGGALTEGLVEELPQSVSEQLLQNIALDRPLDEGVDSAIVMGTLAGMAMGGGMNIVSAPKNFLQNNKAYSEQQNVIAQEQQQLADTNQDQEQHELVGPQIQYDNGFDYSSVPSNEDMNQSILDRILDDDFNEARSRIETAQAQGMNVDSAISQFNDLIARDYQPIDLENIEQIQGQPLEHQETEAFLHNIYDLIDSNDLIEARHRIEEVHKNGGDASQAAGYFNDLIQRQYQPIVSQQKQDTKYGNEVDFQQTLASDSWTMNDEAEEQRANYGNTVNYEHPNINTKMQTSAIPDFVFPSSQTPSERMGINPNDGPMSSAAALAVDTGASPVAHEQTQSSTLAAPQDLQQNENTPLSDASTYMDSAPTYSNPTAQDIQHGMSEIAKGAYEAAIENTIQRLNKDGEVVLFKENSITQALNDQNYNVRQNEDGSASIIGVKNPATNEWHGQSKEDVSQVSRLAETIADQQISQPQEQLTQTERVSQINQSIDDAELKFGNSRKVSEKKEIRQKINDLKNERQLLLEQGNQPTTNLNTENSNLNSQNTSLDAQNNTDKSQTNNVADQLAQLEQNFNAIKGNSVKQAIEKSKIKKQIDQLKFQQPEITTAPFGSEQIQKQYGDTAESVMSDIEILGDDFTIDLRDKNKKTNALNNPNYNAVQKADGSVEIVGMKHPTTGEWVGKKPSTISIEESAQNNMSESTQWTKHPTRKKTWIADNDMMITDESSLGKKTFYVFKDRSGYEQGDFLARAESLIDAKQKAVNILTKNSSEKLPKNTKPIESDPITQPKNFKDSIESIRAEKIRQKDLADMHNSVYGLATDEQLQESLKHLNKEIKKAQKQSENEVVNGKRSTRKAVAAGALDRFLKDRVDLETYIKARKNGELKQRNKKIDDYSRDKLKPDNERKGVSPLDTTFIPLSVVSATRRVLSVLQHLKMTATQDASFSGRINVSLNDRIRVNKVGDMNTYGFSVQVISSFSYLPKVIQNDATYQDENGKTQNYDVSGVWHNGTLYVVADQIYGDPEKQLTTFDAYEELLAHEIVGHFGVQQIFGREYKTKLQQLFNALGGLEGIRKIAKDNGVNMQQFESAYIEPYIQGVKDEIYNESDVQQALVGELFAFVAQNAEKKPFVRQKLKEVLGYIRQWFRDRGFDKFLSRYNDADLMMFLAEARKAVVDQRYFGKYKDQKIETKQDSNIPQYNRNIKPTTPIAIQSDSEIGQTHFIPSHLMDSVNKLGDVVDDLALMRTEGVEYDHDYAVQLLNKIATLNPNIEVIFTRNPKLATGLSEGGYYPFSQDGTEKIYIYPQGNWESDILSLVNHELVHAVTYQAIAQNKVTKDDLNFLKKMSETLRNWMFKNPMALDEWIEYRFDYGINDQYHNELIAVFTAEFDVRQSFSSLQEQLFNESKEQATNFAGTQKNDHAEFQQTPSRDPASTERSSSASRESAENRASQSERQNNSNRTRETRTQVHFLDEFDDIIQRIMALNHEQHKQNRNAEKNKDKPLYSRQSASNSGSTIQQVRNVLVNRFGKDTINELERQGKLEIIQDYQVEGVEGFYHNGKAVLVASNLTAESTVPTFLHELGGHAGFQNMMNQKQYDELMNQFNKLVEQGNPVAMAAKVLAEREQGSERQQLEYLPYLLTLSATMQQRNVLQRNALQKLINNIISYVKAWVFDHFGINLNLNPDDMLALSERMIGQIKHQSSLDLVRQKYQGTHQWMKAPNGAATHLSEQQWLQVRTPEFKKWFGDWENDAANASQVLDENGEPKVVYHGTASEFNEFKQGHGILGDGIYLTDSFDTADVYANIRGKNGFVLPLFVNIRNAFQTTANVSRDEIVKATSTGKYQGVIHHFDDQEYIVALEPNQVKMAEGNTGTFNSESADIRFSRSAKDIIDNLSKNLSNISVSSIKDQTGYKFTDWLGIGLSALGRRQLTEIYSKLLPQLNKYNELAAQMDADKNDAGAEADSIVREWANLKDENELADLMHDATLAKIDPAKPYVPGDNHIKYQQLRQSFNALSPEAQDMYVKARDAYKKHYAKVQSAIKDRILRASLSSQKKADLIKQMDDQFYGYVKGVYFPLARFGKYVVVVRNQNGDVESVSRAETMGEAQKIRSEMLKKFPQWKVEPVIQDKEFRSARDAVGRGFMSSLFDEVANLGLSSTEQASFEDTLNQLYLSSMPDLSWAKHGIHRKGTAGFSQDARRAFAQNMFSGANYLAKLRYGDQLADQLDAMQKYADDQIKQNHQYNQSTAQSVIDEMNKRHENLMNPKGHPLSSALTSLGFIYYLGLSPAAAMVNLSQTALVAYPIMGAKWGFDKAGKELLKASNDFRKGLEFHKVKWQGTKTDLYKAVSSDISKFLSKDEKQAYEDAVARGVIDVTQAHDLAGIAQGEDSGIMWKTRPIMRAASVMFHSAERFNREVTFIAAYRLARQSGEKHDLAFDQAVDATYRGHFDYSSGNRPRIMQGNVAKVLLLFKQFGQNMLYTLARQTYQSIKGETDTEKKEARKSLAAILAMHATFAGTLGLPIVGMLLSLASWMGGDDDDPWDAEIALRNYLAEAFNPTISNMLMKGAPRSVGIDISSRVGINNLLLPDVQEGLEGKRWAESAMAGALGPVAGIGTNLIKGGQEISEGHNLRGVETMLPVFLKNFAKTYRYADEGVQDKTGISIMDEVSSMDLLVQGMGFSPSDVRTANEGKSAIYQFNRKLNERRSRLMTLWSRAKMMDDQQEMDKIWEEIQGFNDKNPSRRITRINLNQSYRNRQRRIDRAEDGIYLSRNRQDAREAGYFAFGE